MKHGIYYAYWEKEWAADYTYYVDSGRRPAAGLYAGADPRAP